MLSDYLEKEHPSLPSKVKDIGPRLIFELGWHIVMLSASLRVFVSGSMFLGCAFLVGVILVGLYWVSGIYFYVLVHGN